MAGSNTNLIARTLLDLLRELDTFCGYGHPPNRIGWTHVRINEEEGTRVTLPFYHCDPPSNAENVKRAAWAFHLNCGYFIVWPHECITAELRFDKENINPGPGHFMVPSERFVSQRPLIVPDDALVAATLGGTELLRRALEPIAEWLADPWCG